MAQFCFGAFRSCSPEIGAAARRRRQYWRGATQTRPVLHPAQIDFSRLSRIKSSKFKMDDQRPLTVSGGKVACAARRLEHEALGG
jgi:hypothetical protein